MMNKKIIITALIIAVAITGIASGLSLPVKAEARECGLDNMGEEASSLAKGGQGKRIGEFISGEAHEENLGQRVSPSADQCRQNS
jgi:hypothetical protein